MPIKFSVGWRRRWKINDVVSRRRCRENDGRGTRERVGVSRPDVLLETGEVAKIAIASRKFARNMTRSHESKIEESWFWRLEVGVTNSDVSGSCRHMF